MTNTIFTVPQRAGERPITDLRLPHTQISQLPAPALGRELSRWMLDQLSSLDHVVFGSSLRAPPGTIGLFLGDCCGCGPERAFLLGREFAHVHIEDDGSLHAILPEPLRRAVLDAGWAEPHPLAGQPTVSPDTVMIYAPRDKGEAETIVALVRMSWLNARGQYSVRVGDQPL
ncbi:luciferase family protein [Sphingobium fluviale]|uniref:Phospholipase n=1 Tax=Sphingobium fluviale TaxID=2506423 RepID=A0A4Q1KFU2_9SPHN|nr:luciferase family protein [Sphingobium fluviale]RXR27687.1 phospholipase [Sphingobium fluviale]